jgi:hypothetical protein
METYHDDRDGAIVITAYTIDELEEITLEEAEKLFDSAGTKLIKLNCPSGRVLTLKVNSPEQLCEEVIWQVPFEMTIQDGIMTPHPTDANKFVSNICKGRSLH